LGPSVSLQLGLSDGRITVTRVSVGGTEDFGRILRLPRRSYAAFKFDDVLVAEGHELRKVHDLALTPSESDLTDVVTGRWRPYASSRTHSAFASEGLC